MELTKRSKVAWLLLTIFILIGEASAAGVGRTGRWFTYNDQPTYLVGFDTQQLAADQNINIPATMDRLAAYRINKVRVWVYNWFLGTSGLTPWQKSGGVHNLDVWDDAYWARMRTLAAEARTRNIVIEVAIFAPYPNQTNYWWDSTAFRNAWNRNFNSNGAFTSNAQGHFYPQFYDLNYGETSSQGKTLRTYQQALVDKAIAELGVYDNVYFEVANEFAVETSGAPVNAIHSNAGMRAWQDNWVQRIDSQSTRLVAVHSDTDGRGKGTEYWRANPAIDILNFRMADASPRVISDSLRNIGAQSANKILTINETFGGEANGFYNNLDLHTRYAWGMFASGGHVAFYEDDPSRILNNPGWTNGANRLMVLRDIAESVRFWEMSPVDSLGNEYDGLISQGPADWQVLANPGSQYVAYFWGTPSNTAVVINLPSGTYTYEWYDVRDKSLRGSGSVSGGGNTTITSPTSTTWSGSAGIALVIKRSGAVATPYPGPNPAAIPGTIQAENFDNGGQGVGYHDAESTNLGGAYRTEGVDIQASSGAEAGGHDVGWTRAGEYLNYTVNVASAGSYTAEIRVASAGQGGTFHIEFNGVDKTGPITVPDTGGWQSWQTLSRTVNLSAGQQTMRIVMDSVSATTASIGNINWVRFTSAATPGTTYVSDLWDSLVFVTNGWGPVERDMSNGEDLPNDGRTITLNGVTYSKGLGAHAVSEVRVPLNGNYARFISDIGIDDEMDGYPGTAQFEVWADGVRLYGPSPDMNASSATITVDVDVTGRQELTLKVLEGSVGCCDHADWAGARLTAGGGSVTPTLTGSLATPPSAVNLTTEGGVDWAHWGMSGSGSFNHRTDGGSQISNYALIGSGTVGSYGDNLVAYSWSNGTPTASATSTTTGMYSEGYGSGFQVTVPADQTTRTVKLYIGAWATTGRLEASLSDNSAPAYVDSSLTGGSNDGGSVGVYTITYRAASAGQQLVLKWTVAGQSGGNVQLQAATLTQQ